MQRALLLVVPLIRAVVMLFFFTTRLKLIHLNRNPQIFFGQLSKLIGNIRNKLNPITWLVFHKFVFRLI